MNPMLENILRTRRDFLTTSANGLGLLALASLLKQDGLLAEEAPIGEAPASPFTRPPHFAPKAKNCIFVFMAGAPSQIDLFDPKPKLNELDGQGLPQEMIDKVRFAFIQKESAVLMGSPRKFKKHGECGMEMSDLLPHLSECVDDIALVRSLHSEAFNHHPGQLMLNCGVPRFGLPSMGSWINYALGTESQNLPGYVVLTAGRGSSGGASNWSSGFLPSSYQGVRFRNQGDPVLNLSSPEGISKEMQRKSLDVLQTLNERRFKKIHDDEITSRIASYELAYRMQSAAPELMELSQETQETLDMYGVGRKDLDGKGDGRGGQTGTYNQFSSNCLLARRLVERGVRFVSLIHASWDHHSGLDDGLAYNCGMADQPIAALLKDLKRRGLLDETLVIWGSEFGRTPLGENRPGRQSNTGRDHHPTAFSVWMAGGGIKGGQVYGETDELGWNVAENPVHINDLHATILHLFGLNHEKLTYRYQGRDFRLTDVAGHVIQPLLA
ncbi:Sulfatase [Planctomycetales bacterium 10988]|nr:Sulfatase [Planctomycetales bacterium 10988]